MATDDGNPPPTPAEPPASPPEERKSYFWLKALIVVGLVIGAWFVIDKILANSKLQDCVMQGRKNCAPIDTYGK